MTVQICEVRDALMSDNRLNLGADRRAGGPRMTCSDMHRRRLLGIAALPFFEKKRTLCRETKLISKQCGRSGSPAYRRGLRQPFFES